MQTEDINNVQAPPPLVSQSLDSVAFQKAMTRL